MLEAFMTQYSGLFCAGTCLLLCLVLTPFTFFLHYSNRKKISTAQRWISTSGRIKTSEVIEFVDNTEESSGFTYVPNIQFTYQVGGQEYIGECVTIGGLGSFLSATSAGAHTTRYPVGKQVTVYYNPLNPAEAALELKIKSGNMYLVIGMLLLAGTACMAFLLVYLMMQAMGR